jgi:hypothetical protein
MDELSIEAAADPALEIATSLRVADAWQLTAEQSTDLDAILTDLERAVRRGRLDRPALARLNGDVTILDATANRVPTTPPAGVKVSPINRAQRVRIKRVLAALTPKRRGRLTEWLWS